MSSPPGKNQKQIELAPVVPMLSEEEEKSVSQNAADFLSEITRDGLFPLVLYSIENGRMVVLTTTIPNLPTAIGILKTVTISGYNLGISVSPDKIDRLASENPHVFRKAERGIPNVEKLRKNVLGRVVSSFGAPFYPQKAFGLVDICGFSRLESPDQLSQLYSLTNALDSAIARSRRICSRLNLTNSFGRASTGDGFYLWHSMLGGGADAAALFVLICVMAQAEAMRAEGFPMKLRASFFVGGAFLLFEATGRERFSDTASNAVGPATNAAARLISAAKPHQILVGDFSRSGQGSETLNTASLITQVNELFREERAGAASLNCIPDKLLRIEDKHGDTFHCWNLAGEVPNTTMGKTQRVHIGLEPDDSVSLCSLHFGQKQGSAA